MRTDRGVSSILTVGAVIVTIVIVAGAFYLIPGIVPGSTTTVTKTSSTVSTTEKQYSMAVVLGGDETDLGFNYVAIQAANSIAQNYGWNVSISRDVSYSDQGRVISTLAQGGYDLVWVVGNQFIGTTEAIAKQYPQARFAQTPSYYQNLTSNIVLLDQSFQVTGYYQAGVLAAKMTHTGAVAVIIGQWYPSLAMEYYAFEAGVNATNPNVKVYCRVAGTWADASLGLQIAQTLIQTQHVDIIAPIADATGRGAFTAAQLYNATMNGNEYPVSIIGTVADQASLAPNNVMTSVLMNMTQFISTVVEHIRAGTWSQIGGHDLFMNLGSLAPFHTFESSIPASVKTQLATVSSQIQAGTLVVHQEVTQNPPPDPT